MTVFPIAGLIILATLVASSRDRSANPSSGTQALEQYRNPVLVTGTVLALAFLVSVSLLNFVVNPLGIYPTKAFEPLVLHSRHDKVEYLNAYEDVPDIVIFGSSRSFTASPDFVEQLTGKIAFNASVQAGSPFDLLALMQLMLDRWGHLPEVLIFGLGPESLGFGAEELEVMEADNPLAPERETPPIETARREPLRIDVVLAGLEVLFNQQHIQASLRSLDIVTTRGGAPFYTFDPDGLGHFNYGKDGDSISRRILEQHGSLYDAYRPTHPDQLAAFEQIFAVSKQYGVHVIVYIPPYGPALSDRHQHQPAYQEARAEMLAVLERGAEITDLTICDFEDPSTLGLAIDDAMLDPLHPSQEAHDVMLEQMLVGGCTD